MKHIINKKDYSTEVESLTNFAQKRMGFSKVPKILFNDDIPNSQKTLGKTGYYDPASSEIHIYASGRHIKDILRSLAHEFVHHMQNEKGDLAHDGYMGQGYAQKNPKMREMERQAYEMGNLCFRDWEDSLKQKHPTIYNERRNRKMSLKDWKNKELNENLNKKWGFSMKLEALEESVNKEYDLEENQDRIFAPNHYCAHHVIHEGKEGYTVDHNYNERLGKVTRYDIKFKDGSIKRNIHESELTILEAFTAEEHKRDDHPPAKRDKDEKNEEMEEEKKKMVKGPDGKMVPDYAADGKGANDLENVEKSDKEEESEDETEEKKSDEEGKEKEKFKPKKGKFPPQFKKKKDMKESLSKRIRVKIKR